MGTHPKIEQIAARGYEDAIEVLACIEVLEKGNSETVRNGLAGPPLNAANIIRAALFSRLTLLTMRPFDPIRSGDEHLGVAFELFDIPHEYTQLTMGSSEDDIKDFEDAKKLFTAASKDPRLPKLRHTRNKELAHLSARDPSIPKPLVVELFSFARDVASIAEKLAFGTGVVNIGLDIQLQAYSQGARAFWAPWERN